MGLIRTYVQCLRLCFQGRVSVDSVLDPSQDDFYDVTSVFCPMRSGTCGVCFLGDCAWPRKHGKEHTANACRQPTQVNGVCWINQDGKTNRYA